MRFELCPVRMEELKQYKLDMQEAFQKGFENKYGKTDQMVLPEKDIDRSLNTEGVAVYKAVVDGEMAGGAVVDIKGRKSHQTVDDALKIVEKVEHRACKVARGETGDGVGILV